MAKKPVKKKGTGRALKPRTRGGGRYTESGYWGFIRSGLRAKWLKWGVRYDVMNDAKVQYFGPDKRTKWLYRCAVCKNDFKQKEVEVDHYPIACGSLKCPEDIAHFVTTLFCEKDNLRVVCRECHQVWTNEEREAKKNKEKEE